MTVRHAGAMLAIGGLLMLSNARFILSAPAVGALVGFAVRHLAVACALVLAARGADRLVDLGAPVFRTYASAIAIVVLLCDPGIVIVSALFRSGFGPSVVSSFSLAAALTGAVGLSIKAGLGMACYVRWREGRQLSDSLRRSQLERAREIQLLHETRLMGLQARVDPQFLFDALRTISVLQVRDSAQAEDLLNDLILHLRALMPCQQDERSTILQEFAIAESYLRVFSRAIRRIDADVHVAREVVGAATLPPLLLLQLIRAFLANQESATTRIRISAEPSPAGLHISFEVAPPRQDIDLDAVRDQLATNYGARALFALKTGDTFSAQIDVPLAGHQPFFP